LKRPIKKQAKNNISFYIYCLIFLVKFSSQKYVSKVEGSDPKLNKNLKKDRIHNQNQNQLSQ